MTSFPTEEALVATYWRKLARSIGGAYKSRRRADRDATLPRNLLGVGAPRRPYHLAQRRYRARNQVSAGESNFVKTTKKEKNL